MWAVQHLVYLAGWPSIEVVDSKKDILQVILLGGIQPPKTAS